MGWGLGWLGLALGWLPPKPQSAFQPRYSLQGLQSILLTSYIYQVYFRLTCTGILQSVIPKKKPYLSAHPN